MGSRNIFNGTELPYISQSMQFSPAVNANTGNGTIRMYGPVSASSWNIANNQLNASIFLGTTTTLNAEKLTAGITINANSLQSNLIILANQTHLTGSTAFASNNSLLANATLEMSSSALQFISNYVGNSTTVKNAFFSQSLGLGVVSVSNNQFFGGTTVQITGSQAVGTTNTVQVSNNTVGGANNVLYTNTETPQVIGANAYNNLSRTLIFGQDLVITGSSLVSATSTMGSAFLGRFGVDDGRRNKTSSTIFSVGTGTSTSVRKTGFLIDSGSNSYFEGTLNVSGSLSVNGNQSITGSLTATEKIQVQNIRIYSGSQSGIYIGDSNTFNPATTGVPSQFSHTVIGNQAFKQFVLGDRNTVIGSRTLQSMTTGSDNLAIGAFAGESMISGSENFFIGTGAGSGIQNGSNNFFLGNAAGNQFRSGSGNIIIGQVKGSNLVSGSGNLIIGKYGNKVANNVDNQFSLTYGDPNSSQLNLFYKSGSEGANLYIYGGLEIQNSLTASNTIVQGTLNVSGTLNGLTLTRGVNNNNTALGNNVLQNAISGGNVAIGREALFSNTSGTDNVALGDNALYANISGDRNMAIGSNTLDSNTTGTLNVAIGNATLAGLVDGSANVGIGFEALKNQTTGSNNVGIGNQALNQNLTGSGNIAFGAKAGFYETGNNNFYINNTEYGSINADRSGSLMWGTMNTNVGDQTLQINARTRFTNEVLFTTGSNQQAGTAVLDGSNPGTVTVSNSLVTANSIIMVSKQTLNHPNGYVAVSAKSAGSFTITSNHNGDTDTVGWFIINNS
jgi:hypothetical protein